MPILRYTTTRTGTVVVELNKEAICIGRGKECEIQIADDSMISRRHAEVRKLPSGEYAVKDLGSKNGTLVNGAPISTWVLKDNDVISVGATMITFKAK